MNIRQLIRKVLSESDAADQAHKLGLTAAGWGTWKDTSGKTVAKTVDDNLVKLEPGEKEPGMATKTKMASLPTEISRLLKQIVKGTVKTGASKEELFQMVDALMQAKKFSEDERGEVARRISKMYDRETKTQPKGNDAVYRNPDFGMRSSRPQHQEVFTSLLGQPREKGAGKKFVNTMFDIMNVSPTVDRVVSKGNWSSVNGETTEGMYYVAGERIELSGEVLESLNEISHYTPEEIHDMVYGTPPDVAYKLKQLRGVQVLIHEMCHAKDASWKNIMINPSITSDAPRFASHRSLTEGLNERIARQEMWSCLSDDPQELANASPAYHATMFSSYGPEVRNLHIFTKIKPDGPAELWALQTAEEREEYIKQFIETDFYSWLQHKTGIDVEAELEGRTLDPRYALWAFTHGRIRELQAVATNPLIKDESDRRRIIKKLLKQLHEHKYNQNAKTPN